jgi:hypothetical protein
MGSFCNDGELVGALEIRYPCSLHLEYLSLCGKDVTVAVGEILKTIGSVKLRNVPGS